MACRGDGQGRPWAPEGRGRERFSWMAATRAVTKGPRGALDQDGKQMRQDHPDALQVAEGERELAHFCGLGKRAHLDHTGPRRGINWPPPHLHARSCPIADSDSPPPPPPRPSPLLLTRCLLLQRIHSLPIASKPTHNASQEVHHPFQAQGVGFCARPWLLHRYVLYRPGTAPQPCARPGRRLHRGRRPMLT